MHTQIQQFNASLTADRWKPQMWWNARFHFHFVHISHNSSGWISLIYSAVITNSGVKRYDTNKITNISNEPISFDGRKFN